MSAVKAPNRMALEDITRNFANGRDAAAKAKSGALSREGAAFENEPGRGGCGTGDILVVFSRLDREIATGRPAEPTAPGRR